MVNILYFCGANQLSTTKILNNETINITTFIAVAL